MTCIKVGKYLARSLTQYYLFSGTSVLPGTRARPARRGSSSWRAWPPSCGGPATGRRPSAARSDRVMINKLAFGWFEISSRHLLLGGKYGHLFFRGHPQNTVPRYLIFTKHFLEILDYSFFPLDFSAAPNLLTLLRWGWSARWWRTPASASASPGRRTTWTWAATSGRGSLWTPTTPWSLGWSTSRMKVRWHQDYPDVLCENAVNQENQSDIQCSSKGQRALIFMVFE